MSSPLLSTPLLLCLALSLPALSRAQDPEDEPERGAPPVTVPPLPGMRGAPGPADEMVELFASVERRLREIDLLLSDAGAGEIPLSSPGESGLADLLTRSREAGSEVLDGIDRILELASSQGQNPQSGSGEQPPRQEGQGDGPLDQPRDGTPGDREPTPEAPGEQPGEQPGEPEQADGQDTKPENPDASEDPGRNEASGAPGSDPPGSPSNPRGAERWGDLPVRVREVFRNKGGGEMPAQYRDWIEAYYRRLNLSGE